MSEQPCWTIYRGDGHTFQIEVLEPGDWSQRMVGDSFPTKLAALNNIITNFEIERDELAAAIAKAKRMRRSMTPPRARSRLTPVLES